MEEYHHDSHGRARIILPPQGLGKVIQVRIKNPEDFLFVGGAINQFHVCLLEDTLRRFDLLDPECFILEGEKEKIPKEEGVNYELLNAGTTRREGDVIYIGGASGDYVILFNKSFLSLVPKNLPERIKFVYEPNPLENAR